MGGCVSERGDLVVVAGNAVQGLSDVSCPLQNDLLRSKEKAEVSCYLCFFFFYSFCFCFDVWFMAIWLTHNACSLHGSRYSGEKYPLVMLSVKFSMVSDLAAV